MESKYNKVMHEGKIAGLYDLEDTIGRGHFAVVKLARHVFTGEKVAVKVIDKTKLDDVSRSHLFQEVRCMKLVQHPNVVRLYEVIDTQTKLYLILELGDGGDMYDHIMKHSGGLNEEIAKRYFRQIVEAISYCHKLHVVHRDLKPENVVFFEKSGLVKLTDFGFSNMFVPGKNLETSCGSLSYSAPEILLGDSYDAPAVDVWSLGVILFMLVVGEAPFREANDSETLTMIMDCKYLIPVHISEQCRDLIGRMLQREPDKRATLSSIHSHPWLNDGDLTRVTSVLPLITRETVADDDQTYFVQKMVEGKIATREEILQSIHTDCYNHITATYYLLIERHLRKHLKKRPQLEESARTARSHPFSGMSRRQSTLMSFNSANPHLEPLMLSPRQKTMKKTRTAEMIPPSVATHSPFTHLPNVVISPTPQVELAPTNPGFVKSLSSRMTLKHHSAQKTRSSNPSICSVEHSDRCRRKMSAPSSDNFSREVSMLGRVDEVMSRSDPGFSSENKKSHFSPVSKIALLSSFFEQKAQQHAEIRPMTNRRSALHGSTRDPRPNLFPKVSTAWAVGPRPSRCIQSLVSPTQSSQFTCACTPLTSDEPSLDGVSANAAVFKTCPDLLTAECSLVPEVSSDSLSTGDIDVVPIKMTKSLESLIDIDTDGSSSSLAAPRPNTPFIPTPTDPTIARRCLKSVCSSPQLLNQIHEETEDEDELVPSSTAASRRYSRSAAVSLAGSYRQEVAASSPEILRKLQQRKKRRSSHRGTSCSSSDASDTDDTEGRSQKDKLKRGLIHRRDSSDHSSDTDGSGNNHGEVGRLGGGEVASGAQCSKAGGGSNGNRGGTSKERKERKEGSDNKSQNSKSNSRNQKMSCFHGNSTGYSPSAHWHKWLNEKLCDIGDGVGQLLSDNGSHGYWSSAERTCPLDKHCDYLQITSSQDGDHMTRLRSVIFLCLNALCYVSEQWSLHGRLPVVFYYPIRRLPERWSCILQERPVGRGLLGDRSADAFWGDRSAEAFLGDLSAEAFLGDRSSEAFWGDRSSEAFWGDRSAEAFWRDRPAEADDTKSAYSDCCRVEELHYFSVAEACG